MRTIDSKQVQSRFNAPAAMRVKAGTVAPLAVQPPTLP